MVAAFLGAILAYVRGLPAKQVLEEPRQERAALIAEGRSRKFTRGKREDTSQPGLLSEWRRRGFPQNPWGTRIPSDLEYKPHWLYTEEDYARIDPSYAERHAEFKRRSAENPWKTTADSQLATLLFSDPGQPNLSIPFDRHFVKHFKDSLSVPIVIDTGKDDPEVQEQKKLMISLRETLKRELDAGNDITAILNAERESQLRLRGLRENLMANLHEIERTATSEQEVSDYIEAANMMLEKEGASKVRMSLLPTRWRLHNVGQQKGERE